MGLLDDLSRSTTADRPRLHDDAGEIARKVALLNEPHIAPLTALVRQLRDELGEESVPWFDPTEGGINARILLLLQSPGEKAAPPTGSGFISPHNDDPSAENMWGIQHEIGLDRACEVVTWNVVPWYVPRKQSLKRADFVRARPMLGQLLDLLPDLRVVVLLGGKAQHAWRLARLHVSVPVLETWHTSPLSINNDRTRRAEIAQTLRRAREIAGFRASA